MNNRRDFIKKGGLLLGALALSTNKAFAIGNNVLGGTEAFIGEICIFSFSFAPKNWMSCNGQLLSIKQNQALFALLGISYGGDGVNTFALPNLQGRAPMHFSQLSDLGNTGGSATHQLSINEIPIHNHGVTTSAKKNIGNPNFLTDNPVNNYLVDNPNASKQYSDSYDEEIELISNVTNVGGNQPHNNMQPYLALNFCIALYGIFPSRN